MTNSAHRSTPTVTPRRWPSAMTILYWVVSLPVLLETGAGAQWDLAKNVYVREIFVKIDFPDYFLTILGVAKILALVALLIPRFPRLKEWAYAGILFVYLGAMASHNLAGDVASAAITPGVLAALTVLSWLLRPASRRDPIPLYQALRINKREPR
jgi:uncharacterized membrane protein YphA (DoxX/SURF4 family)